MSRALVEWLCIPQAGGLYSTRTCTSVWELINWSLSLNQKQKPRGQCEAEERVHTLAVPCSSRKRRERLAASISGVGLSRTCLHHCKGLRDFSGEVNVFEEPTYNLKKERHLHYRYDIDYRKCLSSGGKQHALKVPIETEPHLIASKCRESF